MTLLLQNKHHQQQELIDPLHGVGICDLWVYPFPNDGALLIDPLHGVGICDYFPHKRKLTSQKLIDPLHGVGICDIFSKNTSEHYRIID